jgi:hypothetical protein
MKINKNDLKEMVRKAVVKKLNEALEMNDIVPEDIAPYAKKVDEFIKKTIKEARELHDEGDEMMRSNILSSYEVQERNRFILVRVGFLNTLMSGLISRLESIHKE